MNSENNKKSEPHRVLLNLADKISLKRSDKYVTLWNLSLWYTWKNIKKSYKNKFKISASTWNGKLDLPDGSYSIYVFIILRNMFLRNIRLKMQQNKEHVRNIARMWSRNLQKRILINQTESLFKTQLMKQMSCLCIKCM